MNTKIPFNSYFHLHFISTKPIKTMNKKISLLILSLVLIIGAGLFYDVTKSKKGFESKKELAQRATAINYEGAMIINKVKNINDVVAELNLETPAGGGTFDLKTMAASITAEALKAFSGSKEKSLPLVSSWNTGIPEYIEAMDPMYMIGRIEKGEHILASWKLDPYYNESIGYGYYEESIKKAASLGLPLVFVLPAPESALTKDSYYKGLNKEENPNVVNKQGEILNKLSPFGPNKNWKDVGEQWGSSTLMAQIQEWYPNPPLVLFVSENTADKLTWKEIETSSRYTLTNKDDNFKRTIIDAQWMEKYRQMHEGFKTAFTKDAWKNNVKFISRDKLSEDLGTNNNWIDGATITNFYANIWPLTADGVNIDFALKGTKTDTTADAPHVLANNLPFMLNEAKAINPQSASQLSINADSILGNPARYRGLTQFALWFLRPSFVRQESSQTERAELEKTFQEIADSVELIHYNPQLADFWKNGTLVKSGTSDLNANIPEQYKNAPRWFLLDTDANPKRPWASDTKINVWAFALVKGEAPNREWLVYVQSPEENLTDISVTVPEYDNVELNSTQEGMFYTLSESNTSQATIKTLSQPIITKEAVNTTESSSSPYLEPISIPEYNSSNPEHVLITPDNGMWSSNVLNDPKKKNFYVKPGKYTRLTLTSSGTEAKRRTISLYDNSNLHPSKLDIEHQANISLTFDNANYWTVTRMSNIQDTHFASYIFENESSHNVLDRLNMKDYHNGVVIMPFCNYNTVQLSYLDYMTHKGRIDDGVGLAIATAGQDNVVTKGTKFLSNDIRDAGDGIQLVKSSNVYSGSYPATIIDHNNIWMDGDAYTDGNYSTSGYNAKGQFQIGENAMDFKIGSDNINEPVVVTNNHMWGYQCGDATAGGSQDSGMNVAVIAHYGVENVIFTHNVIFNSQKAFAIADKGVKPYAANNWTIKYNIFYNIGYINPTDQPVYAVILYDTNNTRVEKNVFSNIVQNSSNKGYFFRYEDTLGFCTFKNNIVINAHSTSSWYNHDDPKLNDGMSIIDIDTNFFYNSTETLQGKKSQHFSTASEANLETLDVNISNIFPSEQITLPNVKIKNK